MVEIQAVFVSVRLLSEAKFKLVQPLSFFSSQSQRTRETQSSL